MSNKLQRIEEMEKQLAALRAEVEEEAKPKQWQPKEGEWYYTSRGVLLGLTENESRLAGIERKTKEQAKSDYELARAYNRLLAYKAEFDADFVPDWGDDKFSKFYLYCAGGVWNYDSSCFNCIFGIVYFSQQAAEDLCRKLNSGEVVL